jgi:HK97 family phage major capsid protein
MEYSPRLRDDTAAFKEAHQARLATGFLRYVGLLAMFPEDRGGIPAAIEAAKSFAATTPEVERLLKSAVPAGSLIDPAWAGPLRDYRTMVAAFVEALMAATVIGRVPGVRRIPFSVRAVEQTASAGAGWVEEGVPTPASTQGFSETQLTPKKLANLVILTVELLRSTDPAVMRSAQNDLVRANAQALDWAFLNPSGNATAARPESITHGLDPALITHSTGSSIAQIGADLEACAQSLVDAGSNLENAIWVLHPVPALHISALRGTGGAPAFPNFGARGGELLGVPAIVSAGARPSGSPGEYSIVLVDDERIVMADEGLLTVDVITRGSLQMTDTPSSGAQALVSLWQNGLAAVRSVRFVNWKPLTGAAALIDNVAY